MSTGDGPTEPGIDFGKLDAYTLEVVAGFVNKTIAEEQVRTSQPHEPEEFPSSIDGIHRAFMISREERVLTARDAASSSALWGIARYIEGLHGETSD